MLDATIGGATTNSYVTLAEAITYFSNRAHASEWEAEENQANVLITASSVLDWYVTWKGVQATETQAMGWPRSGVYNKVGTLYAEDVIPQEIKTAVFEYALASLSSDRTADGDLAGLSELKAGSLSLKTDDGIYNTLPGTIPDKVWKILGHLTTRSGIGVVRLIRA